MTSSQYSMAKVKLGTEFFSVDSEEIDASHSEVSDADCVVMGAGMVEGKFKWLQELHLVSLFWFFCCRTCIVLVVSM